MPKRGPHPLVKLIRRQRAHAVTWYGRYRDPATLQTVDVNLTQGGLTTAEERLRWAKDKSAELVLAKRARALGRRSRLARAEIPAAVQAYLDDCRARVRQGTLRESTLGGYAEELARLEDWLARRGRKSTQEITPEDLWAYRDAVIRRTRTARTATSHLTRAQTALHWWRKRGLVPLVTSDAIDDACEDLPAPKAKPKVLRPAELRALLWAAAAPGPLGVGADAGAYLATLLLTGMRPGEGERLRREQLDLDAAPGGEIHLGVEVKTRTARTIDLDVSPALHELLGVLLGRADGPYLFGTEKPLRARTPNDPAKPTRSGPQPLSRKVATGWQKQLQVLERPWTWKDLRPTCGTFLTCAPGIWGASSAYRTARQLGHSVQVSEAHYLGVLRGIPASARTLEAAMEIEAELAELLARIRGRGS